MVINNKGKEKNDSYNNIIKPINYSNYNDKSKIVQEKKEEDIFSEFVIDSFSNNKSLKLVQYINEQINFYGNLSMSRNSYWKAFLEKKFPLGVLFKQINNKKLLKGI